MRRTFYLLRRRRGIGWQRWRQIWLHAGVMVVHVVGHLVGGGGRGRGPRGGQVDGVAGRHALQVLQVRREIHVGRLAIR